MMNCVMPCGLNIRRAHCRKKRLRPESRVLTAENLVRGMLGAWCVGSGVVLLIQVRRIRKYRAVLAQSKPAPEYLTAEIITLSRVMGLSPVRVRVVEGIATPFIWCFGRLQLVWPESLSHESNKCRSRGMLAHELAHVRRHNHCIVWLEFTVGAIWWWNPVYWFVRRQLRDSAEMACDALALSVLPQERAVRRDASGVFVHLQSRGACACLGTGH